VLKVPPIYKLITQTQPREGSSVKLANAIIGLCVASAEPQTWANHRPIRPNPCIDWVPRDIDETWTLFVLIRTKAKRDAIEVEEITINKYYFTSRIGSYFSYHR
jgi:hypothetical protein